MSQCQVCGCNESRACLDQAGRQCAWIDAQENLCSRCALQIFGAADEQRGPYRTALDELRWLDRMVRVQRWLLRQLIGAIWTPGHF